MVWVFMKKRGSPLMRWLLQKRTLLIRANLSIMILRQFCNNLSKLSLWTPNRWILTLNDFGMSLVRSVTLQLAAQLIVNIIWVHLIIVILFLHFDLVRTRNWLMKPWNLTCVRRHWRCSTIHVALPAHSNIPTIPCELEDLCSLFCVALLPFLRLRTRMLLWEMIEIDGLTL